MMSWNDSSLFHLILSYLGLRVNPTATDSVSKATREKEGSSFQSFGVHTWSGFGWSPIKFPSRMDSAKANPEG